MSAPPLPDVAGRRLDGKGFTISREEDRALRLSIKAAPDDTGCAHPIWSHIATQCGMGVSVAELCALCAFDVADGPMLVGTRVILAGNLRTDTPYSVFGEITALTRKPSRKLGILDLLTYQLHLEEQGQARVCSVENTWALPRGHADDH